MKTKKVFSTKEEMEEYLNYIVIWTDATGHIHSDAFHTRKQAENSEPYFQTSLINPAKILTRKQFNKLKQQGDLKQ